MNRRHLLSASASSLIGSVAAPWLAPLQAAETYGDWTEHWVIDFTVRLIE